MRHQRNIKSVHFFRRLAPITSPISLSNVSRIYSGSDKKHVSETHWLLLVSAKADIYILTRHFHCVYSCCSPLLLSSAIALSWVSSTFLSLALLFSTSTPKSNSNHVHCVYHTVKAVTLFRSTTNRD